MEPRAVAEDVLAEQISYYRHRAAEYDVTSYRDLAFARQRIDQVLTDLAPTGRILELACGTGMWTQALARWTDDLTALDSAPEAIAIARTRCPDSVRFVETDLFQWRADGRYDTVFVGFFLSHVPSLRLDGLFGEIGRALAPGGRVFIVDEHVGVERPELRVAGQPDVATRTLADGSTHRLIKVFLDPEQLTARLATLGWQASFEIDEDWVIGELCR
ncbi:MAG: class I SAM-dependent methyltransferase [Pseudonocardiales bacterium]